LCLVVGDEGEAPPPGAATAALFTVLSGCHGILDPEQEYAPLISTDKPSYEAVVTGWRSAGDSFWVVTFTVTLTYANRTGAPLYISYCQGPNPPQLERFVDGDWEVAYQPPHLLCAGRHRIDPGKAFTYDFDIQGHHPQISTEPRWIPTTLGGLYRVVWWPVWAESHGSCDVIPLKSRVSNIFHVTGTLP
jgi:hypothetical protein